jgi:hypothetical protein
MAKLNHKATSNKTSKSRIPEFKSIEEEAEFWDTHSTADFEDEFEDVDDFQINAALASGRLTLFLSDEQLQALENIAAGEGTNVGDIVFKLIDQRLAAERKSA